MTEKKDMCSKCLGDKYITTGSGEMAACPECNQYPDRDFSKVKIVEDFAPYKSNNPAGIDYGLGKSNIDNETGIRFGVIAQNSVLQAWADVSEADYGEPHCPKCGNDVFKSDEHGQFSNGYHLNDLQDFDYEHIGANEFVCMNCKYIFDSDEAYGYEPQGYFYEEEGYKCVDCLVTDIMILKSPFYTFAKFCSPCVPGAGDLDNPISDGVKTYCFGHDWFDEEIAPYPVYRVSDGVQIVAERKLVQCPYCKGVGRRTVQEMADLRGLDIETMLGEVKKYPAAFPDFRPEDGTFQCNVCGGLGKVNKVVTSEGG